MDLADSLPEEVWSRVALFATRPRPKIGSAHRNATLHQSDLAALMRVNSLINKAAGPHLYAEPLITDLSLFSNHLDSPGSNDTSATPETACKRAARRSPAKMDWMASVRRLCFEEESWLSAYWDESKDGDKGKQMHYYDYRRLLQSHDMIEGSDCRQLVDRAMAGDYGTALERLTDLLDPSKFATRFPRLQSIAIGAFIPTRDGASSDDDERDEHGKEENRLQRLNEDHVQFEETVNLIVRTVGPSTAICQAKPSPWLPTHRFGPPRCMPPMMDAWHLTHAETRSGEILCGTETKVLAEGCKMNIFWLANWLSAVRAPDVEPDPKLHRPSINYVCQAPRLAGIKSASEILSSWFEGMFFVEEHLPDVYHRSSMMDFAARLSEAIQAYTTNALARLQHPPSDETSPSAQGVKEIYNVGLSILTDLERLAKPGANPKKKVKFEHPTAVWIAARYALIWILMAYAHAECGLDNSESETIEASTERIQRREEARTNMRGPRWTYSAHGTVQLPKEMRPVLPFDDECKGCGRFHSDTLDDSLQDTTEPEKEALRSLAAEGYISGSVRQKIIPMTKEEKEFCRTIGVDEEPYSELRMSHDSDDGW